MAKMFLVTLSEANSNDIKAQEWALNNICNRVAPLGTVTLTTMYSTYNETLTLIEILVQLYVANGGDRRGEIKNALQALLEQAEAQLDPDQVAEGRKAFKELFEGYWKRQHKLDDEYSDELKNLNIRRFFKPRR